MRSILFSAILTLATLGVAFSASATECETPEYNLDFVPTVGAGGAWLEGQFIREGYLIQVWRSPTEPENDLWLIYWDEGGQWCRILAQTTARQVSDRELSAWGNGTI